MSTESRTRSVHAMSPCILVGSSNDERAYEMMILLFSDELPSHVRELKVKKTQLTISKIMLFSETIVHKVSLR